MSEAELDVREMCIRDRLKDYLEENPAITCGRQLRINYKSIFLPGDSCPGRIKITGIARVSGKTTNVADFKYPRLNYREFGDDGADSTLMEFISDLKGYFFTGTEYKILDKKVENETKKSDIIFKALAHMQVKSRVKENDELLLTPMDLSLIHI